MKTSTINAVSSLAGAVAVCMAIVVILAVLAFFQRWECKSYGQSTDRQVSYVWPTGCLVKLTPDSKFIPRSEIRTQE
jgi:hypothetical protein